MVTHVALLSDGSVRTSEPGFDTQVENNSSIIARRAHVASGVLGKEDDVSARR